MRRWIALGSVLAVLLIPSTVSAQVVPGMPSLQPVHVEGMRDGWEFRNSETPNTVRILWHESGSAEIRASGGPGALVLASYEDEDLVLGAIGTDVDPETGRVYVRRQMDASPTIPIVSSKKFFLQGSRYPLAGPATKVEVGMQFWPEGPDSTRGTMVLDPGLGWEFKDKVGFYGTPAQPQPIVTGSRQGNEALTNLLAALDALGLIEDATTP